ncbi:hypothetical protein ACFP81_05055 [Deinococcus lacus]|uniref:Uncharacterized protein n=1 Tax=Deinococcus lacus TaxID=392561 RepID=A0ABW1YBQ7_9DEIO
MLISLFGAFALLLWLQPPGSTVNPKREFENYFQNPVQQVRQLQVKGSSWQDTYLVMTFELDEPLHPVPMPKLKRLASLSATKQLGESSPCGEWITASSLITLDSDPSQDWPQGEHGRLIVQNDSNYCVFIWSY